MVLGIIVLAVLALMGVAARYGVKPLLAKRNAQRAQLFRIAARNLEGVDIKVPPLPGSEEEEKAKQGWFSKFFIGGPVLKELWYDSKDRFNRLPSKVDALLRNLKDMRDSQAEITELCQKVASTPRESGESPLSDVNFVRWWGSATETVRRHRSLARKYWLAWNTHPDIVRGVREKKSGLTDMLGYKETHNLSFLTEEARLAFITVSMGIRNLEIKEELKDVTPPADTPNAEAESIDDIESKRAVALQMRERLDAMLAKPAMHNDHSREWRLKDLTTKTEATERRVERLAASARAAEIAAELQELVQTMVVEVKAARRIYKANNALSSEWSAHHSAEKITSYPERPTEQDVSEFISETLSWYARLESYWREIPAANEKLKGPLENAKAAVLAVREKLDELAKLEGVCQVTNDSEIFSLAGFDSPSPDHFEGDDWRSNTNRETYGDSWRRPTRRTFDDHRSPLPGESTPIPAAAVVAPARNWYRPWSWLRTGAEKPRTPNAIDNLSLPDPVRYSRSFEEHRLPASESAGLGSPSDRSTTYAPPRRSYYDDRGGLNDRGSGSRYGGGWDDRDTGGRFGSSGARSYSYSSHDNRNLEPEYERPKPPKLTQRWFLTDLAHAYRHAAQAALRECEESVREMQRSLPDREWKARALIDSGPSDAEVKTGLMALWRKLGFAIGQWNTVKAKIAQLEAAKWDSISEPSIKSSDANVYVQAIRTWRAEVARQNAEKAANQVQLDEAKRQKDERYKQYVAARDALANYLQEKDLFEPEVSTSMHSLVHAVRRLLLKLNSGYQPQLKSKAEKEKDRLEAERKRQEEERQRREEEQWKKRKFGEDYDDWQSRLRRGYSNRHRSW